MEIGVLLDLDGVLIDSEELYTNFWTDIEQIYPTGIQDFPLKIKGNALFKILEYFDGDEVKEDIIRRVHKFEEETRYPLYDGVLDFLEQVKANEIPMALVTSSNDKKMQSLFAQHPYLKQYFKAIITDSSVKHSKPHPECYLNAAKALEIPIENCFVFEDSIQGLEAGMNAGATVIGLTTSNTAESLRGKAHYLIDRLSSNCIRLLTSGRRKSQDT